MARIQNIDIFIRDLGFEAYRVGGSVRDEIVGRKPKDADYVVRGAAVDELAAAIAKAGAKPSWLKLRDGRVVGCRANKRGLGLVEIALPRKEVPRERREGESEHGAFDIVTDPNLSLAADAIRRDFTINAMYRSVRTGELIDPLAGMCEIKDRIVRTTHPDSFRDDPLRILRALRFVAQGYGDLAVDTEDQMIKYAYRATGAAEKEVSGTAVTELNKLLMGDRAADALRLMRDTGVMAVFLPELAPMIGFDQKSRYHSKTTDEHTFDAIDAAVRFHAPLRVRLALLFHDAGKPESAWMGEDGRLHYYSNGETEDHEVIGARIADAVMRRLPYEKKLRLDVVKLVERHMVPLSGRTKPSKVRRWRAELGDDLLRDLFKHRLADVIGKGTVVDNDALSAIERLESIRHGAERDGVPTSAKGLNITGAQIMAYGFEGAAIGKVQRTLLHSVLSQPKLNTQEWLTDEVGRIARKKGLIQ